MSDYDRYGDYRPIDAGGRFAIGAGMLLTGLGIGALLMLLLAPQSGRRTRRAIRRSYENAMDRAYEWRDAAGDVWQRGSEWSRQKVAPISGWRASR